MINNSSLKLAIIGSFKPTIKLDKIETLATQIILYKFLCSIQTNNNSTLNNITSLVSTYSIQYQSKFLELKNKYLCYSKIYFILKNITTNNLLSISESLIDKIYNLYNERIKIEDYSLQTFNPTVYNIEDINGTDYEYLKKIHFFVMNPIIQYYSELYTISVNRMKIISCNDIPNNIGKKIVFNIQGIDSVKIYFDILKKNIIIPYQSIKINYPNIELINI